MLKDYKKPEDILGPDGILKQLTAAVVERALSGELTAHLGNGFDGFDEKIISMTPGV